MDKRAYLRSQGFTVGDRGRFSADMLAALAKAPAGSFTEPVPAEKPAKAVKVKVGKTVKAEKPVKSTADPKAVRAWAKANGVEVGDRGRIKPEVFAAYEAAKAETGEKVEQRSEGGASLTGNHAPMLHESDAQWGWTDPHGKTWKVGVRTACANTGVSLGWCPETEHRAIVGDHSLDLVPVRKV